MCNETLKYERRTSHKKLWCFYLQNKLLLRLKDLAESREISTNQLVRNILWNELLEAVKDD